MLFFAILKFQSGEFTITKSSVKFSIVILVYMYLSITQCFIKACVTNDGIYSCILNSNIKWNRIESFKISKNKNALETIYVYNIKFKFNSKQHFLNQASESIITIELKEEGKKKLDKLLSENMVLNLESDT